MTLIATATLEEDDTIVVLLHGTLTVSTGPTVRDILLKSLAGAPEAVLVDVAGLSVEHRSRLAVFPTAAHLHAGHPAPILLYGAAPELAAHLARGVLGDVTHHATLADARTAARTAAPRQVSRRLTASSAAPARARALIAAACRAWELDHLRDPATLVISELVTNAVQHSATDVFVRATLRRDLLHLGVRDSNTAMAGRAVRLPHPRTERGRGLYLVAAHAIAWGTHPRPDGKIVWATLHATAAPLRTGRRPEPGS